MFSITPIISLIDDIHHIQSINPSITSYLHTYCLHTYYRNANKYDFGQKVGFGFHSDVFLAYDDSYAYAVKVMRPNRFTRGKVLEEVFNMQVLCGGENIIRYYRWMTMDAGSPLVMSSLCTICIHLYYHHHDYLIINNINIIITTSIIMTIIISIIYIGCMMLFRMVQHTSWWRNTWRWTSPSTYSTTPWLRLMSSTMPTSYSKVLLLYVMWCDVDIISHHTMSYNPMLCHEDVYW